MLKFPVADWSSDAISNDKGSELETLWSTWVAVLDLGIN